MSYQTTSNGIIRHLAKLKQLIAQLSIMFGAVSGAGATHWLTRQSLSTWHLIQQPQADLNDAGVLLAAGAATLVGLWVTVQLTLLSLVIILQRSRWATNALVTCAQQITPHALRKLVAVVAGMCLSAGTAQAAQAAPAGHAPVAAADSSQRIDPQWGKTTPAARLPRAALSRSPEVVRVERGDSLWQISQRHLGAEASPTQVAREWPRWYAINRSRIGNDPNVIMPGQYLAEPTKSEE